MNTKEDMNIVIVGHVDHGKSTLVGRLLADTGSLPEGKLEQIQELCRRTAKPFEYAFLLDALKDERAQGITIDTARCFFQTEKRNYIILDAPGHIEFLKNMITGAARAEAAVLVIDALEGVQENSKRHGYMLSMLGIRQVAVVINKMDLVRYDQATFEQVEREYLAFLAQLDMTPTAVIPASAMGGENIARRDREKMPWYQGPTVLEALDAFRCEDSGADLPLRMPVQDVYKFTEDGDHRRITAGTVETGFFCPGDRVTFYPSGKSSAVKSIESFPPKTITRASAQEAAGLTLTEQIYVRRGEIMAKEGELPPCVSDELIVNLFWLGRRDLTLNTKYFLKIGCERVEMTVAKILSVMNSSSLHREERDHVACNEVARCVLRTKKPIAFDTVDRLAATSRFVIVDQYEISGGGIVMAAGDRADSSADAGEPGFLLIASDSLSPETLAALRVALPHGGEGIWTCARQDTHAEARRLLRTLEDNGYHFTARD